ncbi:MAG: carbohydrate-binding protein, partial [Spirochaetota bacterium]
SGRLVGVANPRLTSQVAPGNYELLVRKPGLPEFRQRITIGSGGLTINAPLGGAAIQPTPQPIQPAPQPIRPIQPSPQPIQPIQPAPQAIQPIQPAPQPIQPAPQVIQPALQPVQQAPQVITTPAARIAAGRFEAEDHIQVSGGPRAEGITAPENGTSLAFIVNGSFAYYGDFNFSSGNQYFRARVSSDTSGGTISIRSGNPNGTELGRLKVQGTGGWHEYTTVETVLSGANGKHNLYLVFSGTSGYLFNINWFEFGQSSVVASPSLKPAPAAVPATALAPAPSTPQAGASRPQTLVAAASYEYQFIPLSGLTNLRAAVRGPDRFIIAGDGGTPYSSTDGRSWQAGSKLPLYNVVDLSWGNGLYLAVGDGGRLATSNDGVSWTSRTSGSSRHLVSALWTGSQYIVTGQDGTLLTSRDGSSWTSVPSGVSSYLMAVSQDQQGGTIAIVSIDGTILYSKNDGQTWQKSSVNLGSGTIYSLAGGPHGFVAAASSADGRIFHSPDAVNWREVYRGDGKSGYTGGFWDGANYLFGSLGHLIVSPDGVSWTKVAMSQNRQIGKSATGNGALITVSADGSGVMVSSAPAMASAPARPSNAASPATPATPAQPGVSPAIPATPASPPAQAGKGSFDMPEKDGIYTGKYLYGFTANKSGGSQTTVDIKADGTYVVNPGEDLPFTIQSMTGVWSATGDGVNIFGSDHKKSDDMEFRYSIVGEGTLSLVKVIEWDVTGEWVGADGKPRYRIKPDGFYESYLYETWIREGRWGLVGRSITQMSESPPGSGKYYNTYAILTITGPGVAGRTTLVK